MPDIANDNEPRSRKPPAVQPRGLRRVDAARYLGISATHFDKQVKAGAVPPPVERFGVNLWDRVALDAIFEAEKPLNENEWDSVLRHDEETEASARLQ